MSEDQANHLDKVIVEVTRWGTPGKKAEGRVIKILGKAGENETEMHSILAEFGLPYEFPEMVELAAEAISTEITKEEIKKRKDLRKILSFTIDPKDAKDVKDAKDHKDAAPAEKQEKLVGKKRPASAKAPKSKSAEKAAPKKAKSEPKAAKVKAPRQKKQKNISGFMIQPASR